MSRPNAIIPMLAGLIGMALISGCTGTATSTVDMSPALSVATPTGAPTLSAAPAPSGTPSLVPSLPPSPVTSPVETATPAARPTATTARPASPSPSGSASPVTVSCGGSFPITLGGYLGNRYGDFRATANMCVTELTLINDAPFGAGTATVTLDGNVVYSIDIDHWDTIGVPGAGSGERLVVLSTPIGVARGHALSLDYSGCSDCGRLTVWFGGNTP